MSATELTVIRGAMSPDGIRSDIARVVLAAERGTLLKRRWRGVAADGKEFGFDLEQPLTHGDCFYADGRAHYLVEQVPEAVLDIPVMRPEIAARVAWTLGNLHLAVHVLPAAIRVADEPVTRRVLTEGGVSFRADTCVFLPLAGGGHHHGHAHD